MLRVRPSSRELLPTGFVRQQTGKPFAMDGQQPHWPRSKLQLSHQGERILSQGAQGGVGQIHRPIVPSPYSIAHRPGRNRSSESCSAPTLVVAKVITNPTKIAGNVRQIRERCSFSVNGLPLIRFRTSISIVHAVAESIATTIQILRNRSGCCSGYSIQNRCTQPPATTNMADSPTVNERKPR